MNLLECFGSEDSCPFRIHQGFSDACLTLVPPTPQQQPAPLEQDQAWGLGARPMGHGSVAWAPGRGPFPDCSGPYKCPASGRQGTGHGRRGVTRLRLVVEWRRRSAHGTVSLAGESPPSPCAQGTVQGLPGHEGTSEVRRS